MVDTAKAPPPPIFDKKPTHIWTYMSRYSKSRSSGGYYQLPSQSETDQEYLEWKYPSIGCIDTLTVGSYYDTSADYIGVPDRVWFNREQDTVYIPQYDSLLVYGKGTGPVDFSFSSRHVLEATFGDTYYAPYEKYLFVYHTGSGYVARYSVGSLDPNTAVTNIPDETRDLGSGVFSFSTDGDIFFRKVTGAPDTLQAHPVSSPFNLASVDLGTTLSSITLSTLTDGQVTTGAHHWGWDGKTIIFSGSTSGVVLVSDLSTAWDVSTAVPRASFTDFGAAGSDVVSLDPEGINAYHRQPGSFSTIYTGVLSCST